MRSRSAESAAGNAEVTAVSEELVAIGEVTLNALVRVLGLDQPHRVEVREGPGEIWRIDPGA